MNGIEFIQGPYAYLSKETFGPKSQNDMIIGIGALYHNDSKSYCVVKYQYDTKEHTLVYRKALFVDFMFFKLGEFEQKQAEFVIKYENNHELNEDKKIYEYVKNDQGYQVFIANGFLEHNSDIIKTYYNIEMPKNNVRMGWL